MCNDSYSESGAPIAPTRCAEYVALKEKNARLLYDLKAAEGRVTHLERTRYDAHQEVVTGVSQVVAKLGRENRTMRNALREIDSITTAYMSFSPAQYYIAVRQVISDAIKEVV